MITYSTNATLEDAPAIADLHATSWEIHYRGMMTDHYLDHEVRQDRLEVWTERLSNPNEKQHIIMAKENEELVGFTCVFAEESLEWGALLDNIHVLPGHQGKGIGKELLQRAAKWVFAQDPAAKLYLLVFEKNVPSRKFYERMGGIHQELMQYQNQDGGFAPVYRITWPDLDVLVN